MMKLYLSEYSRDDWDNADEYTTRFNDETYYYEVDYVTYYKDEYNYEAPLTEIDLSYDNEDIYIDDDCDPLERVEQEEATINEDVKNGNYPGLWVHHIKIEIDSDYRQVDVDRWVGSSKIVHVEYDSDELNMPDDWDEKENTITDLAEYAEWILEK